MFYKTNEVEFLDEPISFNEIQNLFFFKEQNIPPIIMRRAENEIIYQTIIEISSLDRNIIYKAVFHLDSNIQFSNKLPLSIESTKKIENYIWNKSIENNQLKINSPNSEYTANGTKISIYSDITYNKDLFINLNEGSYSINIHSVDKVGMVSDVMIFDSSKKYLYFERIKYDAFQ